MLERKLFCCFLVAAIATSMTFSAMGQTTIWKDNDPADPCFSMTAGGLIVSPIADPTGDVDRITVGEIDYSIASTFTNMSRAGGALQAVPSFMIGANFTFKIDYYVPNNTSMNVDASFHLQVEFRDANDDLVETFSAGFIDPTVDQDMWLTIEINETVPAGSVTMVPLFVFNSGGQNAFGPAAYVDNVSMVVDAEGDDTTLWEDADPVDPLVSSANGGLVCNPIADPTGDPDRVTVGEVDFGLANQFSSVGPVVPVPITPEMYGVAYNFQVDYYIPSNTTLSDNSGNGGQPDNLYLNTFFDGANTDSAGFITVNNAAFDNWKTLSVSGVIPDGALEANAFIVLAEGGFGGVRSPDAGVAYYLDNIRFSVDLPSGKGCDFDLGDINQDGAVNLLDVGPFVTLLSGATFQCEADINEDGSVNLLDVGPFVDLLGGG